VPRPTDGKRVKFFSEPPEALVKATQQANGSFLCSPTLRSRRLVLVTATADPKNKLRKEEKAVDDDMDFLALLCDCFAMLAVVSVLMRCV
jgi:hypothetical protein